MGAKRRERLAERLAGGSLEATYYASSATAAADSPWLADTLLFADGASSLSDCDCDHTIIATGPRLEHPMHTNSSCPQERGDARKNVFGAGEGRGKHQNKMTVPGAAWPQRSSPLLPSLTCSSPRRNHPRRLTGEEPALPVFLPSLLSCSPCPQHATHIAIALGGRGTRTAGWLTPACQPARPMPREELLDCVLAASGRDHGAGTSAHAEAYFVLVPCRCVSALLLPLVDSGSLCHSGKSD